MVAAALVGAVGGAGGGMLGSLTSYGLNAMAASKSYDRTKNMMTRGYMYQMQGLKNAGINPILAAGAGIKGGPSGSAVAQAHAAASGKTNPGLDAMQARSLDAQANLSTASAVKAGHEADILSSQKVYEQGRANFYGTPEGISLIRDEAYRNSIPNTIPGAAIRGGMQLYNSAKDAFKGKLSKPRTSQAAPGALKPKSGQSYIIQRGNRDPQMGLP